MAKITLLKSQDPRSGDQLKIETGPRPLFFGKRKWWEMREALFALTESIKGSPFDGGSMSVADRVVLWIDLPRE